MTGQVFIWVLLSMRHFFCARLSRQSFIGRACLSRNETPHCTCLEGRLVGSRTSHQKDSTDSTSMSGQISVSSAINATVSLINTAWETEQTQHDFQVGQSGFSVTKSYWDGAWELHDDIEIMVSLKASRLTPTQAASHWLESSSPIAWCIQLRSGGKSGARSGALDRLLEISRITWTPSRDIP